MVPHFNYERVLEVQKGDSEGFVPGRVHSPRAHGGLAHSLGPYEEDAVGVAGLNVPHRNLLSDHIASHYN